MGMQKYICFKDRDELLDVDGTIEVYPLGQLVLSVLDIDWAECLHTALELQRRLNAMPIMKRTVSEGFEMPEEAPYCLAAEYYQSLMEQFKDDYPCLHRLFSAQNMMKTMARYEQAYEAADRDMEPFGETRKAGNLLMAADFTVRIFEAWPKAPDWLEGYGHISDSLIVTVTLQFVDHLVDSLNSLAGFQQDLNRMIEFSLDAEGQYSDLKPEQRFYLMQAVGFNPYNACLPLYETLSIKRRLLNDDAPKIEPNAPITAETLRAIKAAELAAATFYCSDDVCALAFLEFEYLCTDNHLVRKCGHCNRYFLPYSQNTRYCDRIADGDKNRTCKDVAAMAKYLTTIREDEAKSLYRRYANAYQMRCSRAPKCYPRAAYEIWKDEAKEHMEAYKRGEIDLQQFEALIRIPDKR